MFTPSLLFEVWAPIASLSVLALVAFVRSFIHLKSGRWDDALNMLGLFVAFMAMLFTLLSVRTWVADSELATHRYDCIMYELALQRNANPDLTNVVIDPAWHELECYPAP